MSDTPDAPDDEESPAGPRIAIETEMKSAFIDYAMSVIVSRAIPDLRDGLKPVHRRILYTLSENGQTHDKPYRKCATAVGDVMGRYHPHGDSAVYEALVRMAQDFSMSLPLIDGQGNFGSMDGDPPAAYRYTESRLARAAQAMLADIDRDTVDFVPNYANERQEPLVLPARFPNLLVNGSEGIAVGMATRIPPHNLTEVVDATLALIDEPDLATERLLEMVPGPDFPTGGVILGRSGARRAYLEGRGSVLIRARTHIEEPRAGRESIIIDEVPYQVNKAGLVEKIAEAAKEKRVEGIAHVQDESDRHGVRVVIELKRDAGADVVLNQLYRFTPMQVSFGANLLALDAGRPQQLTLRHILEAFIAFREEVVARRTAHDLAKARDRAHMLCGLAVAVANVDEVVATIRASADAAEARHALMTRPWPAAEIADYLRLIDDPTHTINADGTYNLSERQARAILDLRLQRLTAMGVREVTEELEGLAAKIRDYLDILRSRPRIQALVRDELEAVKAAHGVARRTEIVDWSGDLEDEDLIAREEMVVTVTQSGYIKRTPLGEFRAQRRGGKGLSGMATKEQDVVTTLFVADTHTPLLVFTTDGMVYRIKTWRLPLAGRGARGKAMVNVLPIAPGVSVAAILPVDRPEAEWDELKLVFATSAGDVRRNRLSDFTNVMRNGKIAMRLPEGVSLVNARIAGEGDDVLLVTAAGQAIRFPVGELRVFRGREATGVRGIRLDGDDRVVAMAILRHFEATPAERAAYQKMRRAIAGMTGEDPAEDEGAPADPAFTQERYTQMSAAEELILTITERGLGKLSSSHDYPVRGRGGMGVRAVDKAGRGGRLVAAFPVEPDDQVMLVTSAGQSIRCPVAEISLRSRSAGGVKVFDTAPGERVVSVAWIAEREGEGEGDAGPVPDGDGETGP